MKRTDLVFALLLSACFISMTAGLAFGCPATPCPTIVELGGHWTKIGGVTMGSFWEWADGSSIWFRNNPPRVAGYVDNQFVEQSPITLSGCSSLTADPGIDPRFGTFRPADSSGTACVAIYYSWNPILWGFECQTPCLLIQSHDIATDPAYTVFEWAAQQVPVEQSTWSTMKALYGR